MVLEAIDHALELLAARFVPHSGRERQLISNQLGVRPVLRGLGLDDNILRGQ